MASENASPPTFPPLESPGRLLLGPGPSSIHPRILSAMAAPLVGHFDPYYYQVMAETQTMLRPVFGTSNPLTLIIPGTGTAAMEAAIANVLEPRDSILVCAKGFFGQRMADVARRHMVSVQVIERAWGQAFTTDDIASALARSPVKVVAIVHGETSTGVLQPLEEIARVVHDSGGLLLVDAVTSLGGIPVDIDRVGIDVCYSCSQKCLGSPPGLGPISLSPRAVEVLRRRQTPVSPFYLDLGLLASYWGPDHVYHHTAPISSAFAFHEALRLMYEEGLAERYARHTRVAQLLWDGLTAMGLELFVPREHRLPTLTTVRVPFGVDDALIRRRLLEEYNIEIGAGFGELKGKIWRIGLMGHSCRTENVLTLLAALERLLSDRPA